MSIPAVNGVRFLPVAGCLGYVVGADGSVWSCWKHIGGRQKSVVSEIWKRMSGTVNSLGRPMVKLKPMRNPRQVNRMVAIAFLGPCPDGMECCHNDGNPLNNAVGNLRWDTHKSNMADKKKHGTWQAGEKHGNAKVTEDQVREMRMLWKSGVTQVALAKRFGISQTNVSDIVTGKRWPHVILDAP